MSNEQITEYAQKYHKLNNTFQSIINSLDSNSQEKKLWAEIEKIQFNPEYGNKNLDVLINTILYLKNKELISDNEEKIIVMIYYHNVFSNSYFKLNLLYKSLEFAKKSINYGANNDSLSGLIILGDLYKDKQDFNTSNKYYLSALNTYFDLINKNKIKEDALTLTSIYYNLANNYMSLNNYAQAEIYALKSDQQDNSNRLLKSRNFLSYILLVDIYTKLSKYKDIEVLKTIAEKKNRLQLVYFYVF